MQQHRIRRVMQDRKRRSTRDWGGTRSGLPSIRQSPGTRDSKKILSSRSPRTPPSPGSAGPGSAGDSNSSAESGTAASSRGRWRRSFRTSGGTQSSTVAGTTLGTSSIGSLGVGTQSMGGIHHGATVQWTPNTDRLATRSTRALNPSPSIASDEDRKRMNKPKRVHNQAGQPHISDQRHTMCRAPTGEPPEHQMRRRSLDMKDTAIGPERGSRGPTPLSSGDDGDVSDTKTRRGGPSEPDSTALEPRDSKSSPSNTRPIFTRTRTGSSHRETIAAVLASNAHLAQSFSLSHNNHTVSSGGLDGKSASGAFRPAAIGRSPTPPNTADASGTSGGTSRSGRVIMRHSDMDMQTVRYV